jgi:hypothetical protein
MARLSPGEERELQARLAQERQQEEAARKENALNRVRFASTLPDLTSALADYLQEYT